MFIAELKRAILRKKFMLLIIFGMLIIIIGSIFELKEYIFFNYNASDLATAELQNSARDMVRRGFNKYAVWFSMLKYYTIAVPILASLPYSTSFLEDRKFKIMQAIDSRINHNRYIVAKFLSNGIAGGLSTALPIIIGSIMVNILFSGNIDEFYAKGAYGGIFSYLVIKNFYLYIIIHTLLLFCFGFAYSSIALAVSTKLDKNFAVMIFPLLFFIVSTIIGQVLDLKILRCTRSIEFYLNPTVGLGEIFLQVLVFILVTSVIFFVFSRKEYIYE
ncbi:hypothetical protein [Clostridium manihotivorum]|uniref:ABC-2 family transporter protein n=1 Tax=Clostridium manihotivorum TaxID=2320868 RepID=A0A3R5QS20_9CLOT|nr:hypothetical protein [Clostridium manihotivorum]QAA31020.1 hypothetical protein C1I91_04730 [Clostridium manihotivorum]